MTELSEAQKKRIDDITFDEQKLLEMSIDHSGEHQYAADYRIGFRYGFNRGKVAGYQAGLQDPSRSEALDKVLGDLQEAVGELEMFNFAKEPQRVYNADTAVRNALSKIVELRKGQIVSEVKEIQEVIKHAAVMSDQGWIFLGKCHADCFNQMRGIGVHHPKGSFNQGFVTNLGRFVPRNRALDIAVKANQCTEIGDSLISEMLWHENDGGKFNYDSINGYTLKLVKQPYKNAVCRGSKALGTACGTCERCKESPDV